MRVAFFLCYLYGMHRTLNGIIFCLTIILFTSCSSDYDKYVIPEKKVKEKEFEIDSDGGMTFKLDDTLFIVFTRSTKDELDYLELHPYNSEEVVIIEPKDFISSKSAVFVDRGNKFGCGDTISIYRIKKNNKNDEWIESHSVIATEGDRYGFFKKNLEEQLMFNSLFPNLYEESVNVSIDSNLLVGNKDEYEEFYLNQFPKLQVENTDIINKESLILPFGEYQLEECKVLFFYQQDDYGVNAFMGKYFAETHSLIILEKIAWNFGDAGDLQTCSSKIKFNDGSIEVIKNIKTCHSDLEVNKGEVLQKNEECIDSINVIRL